MTALMGLDVRLKVARLYVSTDLREETDDFGSFVEAAFAGGVDVLQVRQANATLKQLVDALDLARTIAYHYQGLVVVNDDLELAQEFETDVLHLGQVDGPSSAARAVLHEWALLGRSAHSEEQVDIALADPEVDYLSVGPVYASTEKPEHEPPGLPLVRYAARVARPGDIDSKPWFVSGGIDEHTIDAVIAAGARRVWVTRALTEAPDAEAAAHALSAKLREAWNNDPAMQDYLAKVFLHGGGGSLTPTEPSQ